jgi:hypothetical protein
MIGDPHPDFTYGVTFNCSYKGFDFSIQTSGVGGNQIAKSYRSFADNPIQNYTTEIFGRWHGEGTSNKLPRVINGTDFSHQQISDIYIEDGDYYRINNVTLGFDVKKVVRKLPFAQLRLYVTAQNLYTFTNYTGMDPEVGYCPDSNNDGKPDFSSGIDLGFYPSPRTYMVGVNIKF